MIRSINLKPVGRPITEENPFGELLGKKGATQQFEDVDNNYIAFMIAGILRVTDCRGNIILMKANHMYAFSTISSPYHAEALDDCHCLVLLSSSLRSHINAENVRKVLSSKNEIYGVAELPYNDVIKQFIDNLLLINELNSANSDIYTIKKIEFIHYLRRLYTIDEISKFVYGILSTYSEFKMGVLSVYNNTTNVQEMADKLFMTTKTFTRRFRDEFNTTPHEWIVDQKIYNLAQAIEYKRYPLSQILEEFSFSSYSAFKQFCKRYDVEHIIDKL